VPLQAIDRSIHTERVRVIFQQMPLTLIAVIINAALTAWVLAGVTPTSRLLVWLAALVVISQARFLLLGLYHFSARQDEKAALWGSLSVVGSAAAGVLWGSASLFLTPSDEPHQLFLAFVIAGMCAGSVTVNSAHLPSVVAFVLPASLPLAAFFAFSSFPVHNAMAVLTVFFAASVLLAARRSYRYFGDTIRLRFELAERTEALNAVNGLLRTEIEQHRSTEAALRHAQKMDAVGRLTAGIAHDFNNLLMAITASVEVLQKRLGPDSQEAGRLANIRQAAARGANLTRQLLAFASKQALRPGPVDLNDVVRDSAELLASTLGDRIRIDLRLEPELPMALVDQNQIEHAILNLAINARDAMPGGGTLEMATARVAMPPPERAEDPPGSDCIMVAIGDTGTGMAEDVLAKAFDPFFTTKERGKGSGLGLSQVYGVIRQSGGTTRIESTVGRGTTVKLFLPLAERMSGSDQTHARRATDQPGAPRLTAARDAPMPAHPVREADRRIARILLLDDDPMVLVAASGLLREAGHTVIPAETGEEALKVLHESADVDLFVVDFAMPGMSGDEVAREARLARPSLPVLFMTGYADVEELQDRMTLHKPFSGDVLLQTVADALGDPASAPQSAS
jgi:signal transduction histidine kinase